MDIRVLCDSALEGNGRLIPQSGMQASGVVVSHVLIDGRVERAIGEERDAACELRLEGVKERLGVGIVAWSADARALEQAALRDERTERGAHVLGPAITVKDQAPADRRRRCSASAST